MIIHAKKARYFQDRVETMEAAIKTAIEKMDSGEVAIAKDILEDALADKTAPIVAKTEEIAPIAG